MAFLPPNPNGLDSWNVHNLCFLPTKGLKPIKTVIQCESYVVLQLNSTSSFCEKVQNNWSAEFIQAVMSHGHEEVPSKRTSITCEQ